MDGKAKLSSYSYIAPSNTTAVVLEVEGNKSEELGAIRDGELVFSLDPEKKKRSLNANAYFHVLVNRIADKIGASKPYTKNYLIGRYGQYMVAGGEIVLLKTQLEPELMEEREDIHVSINGYEYDEDGVKWNRYIVFEPTHTYSSEAMQKLIQGAVEEAKDLGIETLTPEELQRLVGNWQSQ